MLSLYFMDKMAITKSYLLPLIVYNSLFEGCPPPPHITLLRITGVFGQPTAVPFITSDGDVMYE
jgi:hypothetical protein